MPPRSSTWSPFEGCWHAALTPAEWAARFGGTIPAAIRRRLVSGPRARYVPCIHAEGCRQPHRVKRTPDGQWLAIPEAPDCEHFEITSAETETLRLDFAKLGRAIAAILDLQPTALEIAADHPHMMRFARQGKQGRPCFLVTSGTGAELATACDVIAAKYGGSACILAANEAHATESLRQITRLRGGTLLALGELVGFGEDADLFACAHLLDREPLPPPMSYAPLLGGRARFSRGNTWPHARPANPRWSDITFMMQLQEVAITFGASQGSFDYREIDGFTDGRSGKRPNRLWHLLQAFARQRGTLPLPHKEEDPTRVRTLSELERVLERFFAIGTAPFDRDRAANAVTSKFKVRSRD